MTSPKSMLCFGQTKVHKWQIWCGKFTLE